MKTERGGNVLDVHIIGSGCVLRSAVIFFYISNEGISIIENATRIGLPVPQKLQDMILQLQDNNVANKKGEKHK